uniref:Alpha-type protein kinase domain-containing protein n=1 Tax=Clytia hemisphaerica TaxID=252671 RepID=A0A7M5XME7_9CNID
KKNIKEVSTLIVHRMKPVPVGKLKRYEPAQPRDFIDFSSYSKLTLKNVKDACEKFYGEAAGSCDVLYDVLGPSCSLDEQLSGMKFFRVRFVKPSEISNKPMSSSNETNRMSSKRENDSVKSVLFSKPVKSKRKRTSVLTSKQPCPQNSMPTSISIGDLLNAGKLVIPTEEKEVPLILESFNIKHGIWLKQTPLTFRMQLQKFADGGFRNAFKAYKTENDATKMWVIKKFKATAWEVCGPRYEMTLEQHTRKQVQMHTTAKAITVKCVTRPGFREKWFTYQTIFFSILDGEPVTVEPFVDGAFIKYLNNDGVPCKVRNDLNFMYEKAEALTHFSYQESYEKLLLVDLQGSGYTLYDPEIATADELQQNENERYFCAGNLNETAFTNFFDAHKCNIYCRLLGLKEVELEDPSVNP